jgi:hypothetical protein
VAVPAGLILQEAEVGLDCKMPAGLVRLFCVLTTLFGLQILPVMAIGIVS